MIDEEEKDIEVKIEKPSRAKRWARSIAARFRRSEVKVAKEASVFKEEKDARERVLAERRMKKLQRRKKRREQSK